MVLFIHAMVESRCSSGRHDDDGGGGAIQEVAQWLSDRGVVVVVAVSLVLLVVKEVAMQEVESCELSMCH
jgi:hypothetical protein